MICPDCDGTDEDCETCDGDGEVEPCCICDEPSRGCYDDREDCPSCGRFMCEYRMQTAMDYHDERGT